MTMCYFLKLLAESALYFVGANCVLYSAGGINGIPIMLICVAVGTLGHLIDEKHSQFRFLLLPFLLLVLRYGTDFASYLVVILPALYVGLTVVLRRYYMEYNEAVSFVKIGMGLSAFLTFAFAFIMGMQQIITYILIFLFSGIFTLRMLRQNIRVAKDPKYRLMNAMTVGGIVLLTLILGSETFLDMVGTMISTFHKSVIMPVLNLLIGLFIHGLSAIIQILKNLFPSFTPELQKLEMMIGEGGMAEEELETYEPGNFVETLILIAKVLAVILGILAVVLFVLKAKKGRNTQSTNSVVETRTTVTNMRTEEKIYSDIIAPREARAAVRYHYRNFLRLCASIGITFPRHYTSLYIQNMVADTFDKDTLNSMRQTYIRARYSDEQITQEDVTNIKGEVKKLKEQMKDRDRSDDVR